MLLSHVSWATGALLDVAGAVRAARRAGAAVVVDGAQSVGAIPVDVAALGVDAYAFPAHKWLLGPEGLGALWVAPGAMGTIDLTRSGLESGRDHTPEGGVTLHPGARRHEASTPPAALLPAWRASLAWLDGLGWDWIHARVAEAQAAARAALAGISGVRVLTPPGPQAGLVTFTVAGWEPEAAAARMLEQGVVVRWLRRPSALRASLGLLHDPGRHRAPRGRVRGARAARRLLASWPVSQDRLVIRGGRALSGTIVPSGNKNAALPILAACLLTDEEVVLENVPDILDVHVMLALLDDLGVSVRDEGPNALALRADRVRTTQLDPDLCRRLRASLLLAGPLLARCGEVELPLAGGDFIGRRRVDTHLLGFRGLGAETEVDAQLPPPPLRAARRGDLPRRGVGHGHRERADGGGARDRPLGDPQRRRRAARPGPRALPGGARARRSRASAPTAWSSTASTASTAAGSASAPTTSRSPRSSASAPSRAPT